MFNNKKKNKVFVEVLLLIIGCLGFRISAVQAGTDHYGRINNSSDSTVTGGGTNAGNQTYTGYTPVTGNYTPSYSPKVTRIKRRMTSGTQMKLKVKGFKVTKWLSTNKKIATVSKKGVVTAKSSGKTLIKATAQGKTLICELTVYKNELKLKLSDQDFGYLLYGDLEYGVTKMSFDKNGNFYISMRLFNRTRSNEFTISYIDALRVYDKGNKSFVDVWVQFYNPIVIPPGGKKDVNIYIKRKNVDRIVDLTKIGDTYRYGLDIEFEDG